MEESKLPRSAHQVGGSNVCIERFVAQIHKALCPNFEFRNPNIVIQIILELLSLILNEALQYVFHID